MDTPLIEFRNVTKGFGNRTILDRMNLRIFEGDITTIIGKSGTGKSVLLKHIIGLLSPDDGDILFYGKTQSEMSRHEWDGYRSQVSYMFQGNALFDSMTVFDNIALPLRETTALDRKEIEERVMNRIEQTELGEVAFRYPAELSGGMQKRAALARALVTDPKIVLFDEPTTGQDPIRRNVILSMIAQYKKKFDFTAIVISHEIPDIFFISDRILLLWEGTIAFQGTFEELSETDHPMRKEYLASLEGLGDELTGLLSKHRFRSRYKNALEDPRGAQTFTAITFSVELDLITENLGPLAAMQVVQRLGEHISRHFDGLGGFSARQNRDQILTILPLTKTDEIPALLKRFAGTLKERVLCTIQEEARAEVSADSCFYIFVYAGVTEAKANEDVGRILEKTGAKQKIIAEYKCETGGTAL